MLTTGFGAAYGTSKAGVAVMTTSILRPDRMIQNTLPVLMAGIIAIYGLVAGIIITDNCPDPSPHISPPNVLPFRLLSTKKSP